MADEIDVFDDVPEAPNENGLGRLRGMFDRRQVLVDQKEALEAELKIINAELTTIDEKEFPELFDEVGITSFTAGNRKVSVEEKLYGSLPKDPAEREEAIEVLRKLNGDGIIKNELSVMFTKGEDEKAKQLFEELHGRGVPASLSESVHPQTYQAWAREQLANGVPLDLEVLGLYNRRFVKIK